VWNEEGATLDFVIPPMWYETNWFRALCVVAFLGLFWALYQLRVHQLRQKFAAVLDARVNERTRIARDLHDTMLQSFHGVLMKLYGVTCMLGDRPEARQKLEDAVAEASHAIAEGRDAVQGLRSSTVVSNELAQAIRTLGEELAAGQPVQNRSEFRVVVEGTSRDFVPILRDEIYRLGCEAVRNAFAHANAKLIEVGICYSERQFQLRVRDNGRGIDPKVLEGVGRPGHYGLPGMHERARLVKGKLLVRSKPDSGTEIELNIPASVAYTKSPDRRRSLFFRKGA